MPTLLRRRFIRHVQLVSILCEHFMQSVLPCLIQRATGCLIAHWMFNRLNKGAQSMPGKSRTSTVLMNTSQLLLNNSANETKQMYAQQNKTKTRRYPAFVQPQQANLNWRSWRASQVRWRIKRTNDRAKREHIEQQQ